jgi:transposase
MSYRVLTMIEVKEILRRKLEGQGAREIARQIGCDRKTVRRYIEQANKDGIQAEQIQSEQQTIELTDEQVGQVASQVQGRPKPKRSDAWVEISKHREQIGEWLGSKKPLHLKKIHKLLLQRGVQASYWTLRRFVIQELGWKRPDVTILLEEPEPGLEAQLDFGEMGKIWDEKQDRWRKLWVLIVTLSFSRFQFVWPTFHQTTEAVCEGLDAAWEFFGGMARTIIPDNTKAMIQKPNALSPRLTQSFLDYAQERGIFVDAARVRRPKDKAKVERQVRYVRGAWFSGEQFLGLEHAKQHAKQWCLQEAGTRIHGTTRQKPIEVYEKEEKSLMLPAPMEVFDMPRWGKGKVHRDCHVRVQGALYSVSHVFVGKELQTRADRRVVKLFYNQQCIKIHPRKARGERSTEVTDYPPGKAMYARRSLTEQLEHARTLGEHIGRYVERLLDFPAPWIRARSVHALFGLCERYGKGRVEAVCQSALAFDVVDVLRIRRMLEKATEPAEPGDLTRKVVALKSYRFARSAEQFSTKTTPSGEAS